MAGLDRLPLAPGPAGGCYPNLRHGRGPTHDDAELISLLLSDPDLECYGLQLAGEAGLKSGSVYVVLSRLEQAGWLTSRWEEIDPVVEGRPRRRLYTLTGEGRRAGAEAVEHHLRAFTGVRSARAAGARHRDVAPT